MRKNIEQYEAILNSANKAANAYLDMEGGEFLLSWASELIQDLATEGNVRSATLTAQKLCEAVGVEVPWAVHEGNGKTERLAWLRLFSETLMDRVSAN